MAQWVIPDTELYASLIAKGWIDTGYRRTWCGGTLVSAILISESPREEIDANGKDYEQHRHAG